MTDILQDLSPSSLISAIEGNMFAIITAFRKWPRAEIHNDAEVMRSMTDIPFPLFNSIMHAQLQPERIDAVIKPIIAQAESRNVPLLWWTGPTTQPMDLGIHLERYGFVGEGQIPGMAVDLANLNDNPPLTGDLTVQHSGRPGWVKRSVPMWALRSRLMSEQLLRKMELAGNWFEFGFELGFPRMQVAVKSWGWKKPGKPGRHNCSRHR